MNRVQDLLAELRQDGVQVWVEDHKLRYYAPPGGMNDERLNALRAIKNELIDFLQQTKQAVTSVIPLIEVQQRPLRLPLSYMQERLWILNKIESLGSSYHIIAGFILKGVLNRGAFERALNVIVNRHESLRTRFATDGESVEQIIEEKKDFLVEFQDISSLDVNVKKEILQSHVYEFVQRPFDLEGGSLFRALLIYMEPNEHVVAFTMHHIISDGWSLGVLLNELSILYNDFSQGKETRILELPVQYVDYSLWQRNWLHKGIFQHQMNYWKKQLEGIPSSIYLPIDYPRNIEQSFRGSNFHFKLSKTLTEKLVKLARAENVTLFMVLLAVFQQLLVKLSGQNDIVIGTPVAGRKDRLTEKVIGFFVNTLVLRLDVSGDLNMKQLLMRTRDIVLQAYAHQDLPYEKLVEELNPIRNRSQAPIFQVLLALHNYPEEELNLTGLQIENLDREFITSHSSKRDLSLHMVENADGISGVMQYASDLFEGSTIESFVQQYEQLLAMASDNPTRRFSSMKLESTNKLYKQLIEWNNTTTKYPTVTLHQLFEEKANLAPESIALVFEGRTLSYAELNCKANRVAHYLRSIGIGPDSLVAIFVERSPEMIIGLLGVLKAGGAYLPLSPSHPTERLVSILNDSLPKAFLTLRPQMDHVDNLQALSPFLSKLPVVYLDADLPTHGNGDNLEHLVSMENLAYVIYTSGTTGSAKGVGITHGSICNFSAVLASEIYGNEGPLNLTLNASYVFDMSLKHIAQLAYGHTLHILNEEIRISPADLIDYFRKYDIHGFECTPSQLKIITNYILTKGIASTTSLPKFVLIGGESINKQYWDKLKLFTDSEFFNMYGPTEATVDCALSRVSNHENPTIGRPIANYQIYVLDGDLQPVPIGVSGELYIAGYGLARGYLNNPMLTAEKFIPDPFSTKLGTRMYKSGDLARFTSDGSIEYVGRLDDQVKIRGYRIELEEIESKLLSLSNVRNAVVVTQDTTLNDKKLIAYIIMNNGKYLDSAKMRSLLLKSLPNYMIPSEFIAIDKIPLTENGKIDRKSLPPSSGNYHEHIYSLPKTQEEISVAKIWASVLGLERVSLLDNFFEIGGDSLLAVCMVARIQNEIGVSIPIRELYSKPNLMQFSELISSAYQQKSNYPNVSTIRKGETRTPLFCIHPGRGEIGYAYNLSKYLDITQPLYGISASGFMPEEKVFDTIEDMANYYVSAIRDIQNFGPYRLIGWSAGGIIAWEMARQLLNTGQQVEFLGLIDTDCNHADKYNDLVIPDLPSYLISIISEEVSSEVLSKIKNLASMQDIDNIVLYLQQIGLLSRDLELATLKRHLLIRYGIIKALKSYRPSTLPINITAYCATFEDKYYSLLKGWKNIQGKDRIKFFDIQATHHSIVEEPSVQVLGEAIQQEISKLSNLSLG